MQEYVRDLTAQHIKILRLMADGLNAKEVGKELRISDKTVKSHLTIIRDKMDAKNTTHAVVLAMRRGLID